MKKHGEEEKKKKKTTRGKKKKKKKFAAYRRCCRNTFRIKRKRQQLRARVNIAQLTALVAKAHMAEHWTPDRKVASLNPGRSAKFLR